MQLTVTVVKKIHISKVQGGDALPVIKPTDTPCADHGPEIVAKLADSNVASNFTTGQRPLQAKP